jgi:gamma-glutamylcyclotransferase (GGCT)/AIG2-like uncharacterized protein YtfP
MRFKTTTEIPEKEKIRIGVYGTLKRGYGNYSFFLKNSRFIGTETVKNLCLYALGGFPGAKYSNLNKDTVEMEVFEITPEELNSIDSLEGVPFLYERVYDPSTDLYFYLYNRGVNEENKIERW